MLCKISKGLRRLPLVDNEAIFFETRREIPTCGNELSLFFSTTDIEGHDDLVAQRCCSNEGVTDTEPKDQKRPDENELMSWAKQQFWGGFSVGLCVSLFFLWTSQTVKKKKENVVTDSHDHSKNTGHLNTALDDEQLVRTCQFFGQKGLNQLKGAYVVVVGLGGVGSHCVMALARSGVGHLKLIDFDQVSLSSLNRHACATREHVGFSKVEALKMVVNDILPFVQIETEQTCFNSQNASQLVTFGDGTKKADFVIDCIDNVESKVDLIEYCYKEGIPCISSGGSGGRADPTKIRIDDIKMTAEDPLCATIRILLRKRGIDSGCMICYSTEKCPKKLLPLQEFHENKVEDYRLLDKFRVRVIPVIATIPAIFGHALASYVLTELTNQSIKGLSISTQQANAESKLSRKNYKQLFDSLKQFSNGHGRLKSDQMKHLHLCYSKTRWLYVDVYHGSCIITGDHLKPRGLQLIPWRCINQDLVKSLHQENNVICLKRELARKHLTTFSFHDGNENLPPTLQDVWDSETIHRVDAFLSRQEPFSKRKMTESDPSCEEGVET